MGTLVVTMDQCCEEFIDLSSIACPPASNEWKHFCGRCSSARVGASDLFRVKNIFTNLDYYGSQNCMHILSLIEMIYKKISKKIHQGLSNEQNIFSKIEEKIFPKNIWFLMYLNIVLGCFWYYEIHLHLYYLFYFH